MKLTQLRYFQAACRLGSVTAASKLLHISQPSVSAAIRELEREFGVALLDRKSRGFSLTHAGQTLLEQANSLLLHADRVETLMQELSHQRRRLRLGVPPMIGSLLLPRLYQEFIPRFPRLELSIAEGGRQELLHLMGENHLDLAFLPHDGPVEGGYHSVPVMQMETTCCVCRGHRLADRSEISIEDLVDEPLVLFKNSFFQTETLLHRFQSQDLTPNVLLHTNQLSTLRQLISSGAAAGFLFRELVDSDDDLIPIPLMPPIRSTVSLIWRPAGDSREMEPLISYVRSMGTLNPPGH